MATKPIYNAFRADTSESVKAAFAKENTKKPNAFYDPCPRPMTWARVITGGLTPVLERPMNSLTSVTFIKLEHAFK